MIGHVAVPLPPMAGARGEELEAAVPALVHRAGACDRPGIVWGRRHPDDPRGGKVHLQLDLPLAQTLVGDPAASDLLRAVARRLALVEAAAERLLGALGGGCAATTVRANVYEPGGGVPSHVDDSAFTVVFTAMPGELLLADSGRRVPLHPVAGDGWHAVAFPGRQAGVVVPGLAVSIHAAAPALARRLSVTVFATVPSPDRTGRPAPARRVAVTPVATLAVAGPAAPWHRAEPWNERGAIHPARRR